MRSLGNRLAAGLGAEAGGYIGVPVLIVTGVLAWRSRRRPRTQLAAVLFLVAVLLSLGPHLAANGRGTGIPLPFVLLDRIPLLDNLLPSRFNFETDACLAALIAFGLDDLRRSPGRSHRHAAARPRSGAHCLCRHHPRSTDRHPTAEVAAWKSVHRRPPCSRRASAWPFRPATLWPSPIRIPRTRTAQPMLWQAQDAYRFRLLGGYGYHTAPRATAPSHLFPSVMKPPELQQFLAGLHPPSAYGPPLPVTPDLVRSTRVTSVQVPRPVGHRGSLRGRKCRGAGALRGCAGTTGGSRRAGSPCGRTGEVPPRRHLLRVQPAGQDDQGSAASGSMP